MKCKLFLVFLLATAFSGQTFAQVSVWLTNADKSALFARQKQTLVFKATDEQNQIITLDETVTYQTIDGFGFALTGGSAMHIIRMAQPAREALLKELFATNDNNIGVSYLRLSIGASDLNDHVFSYDDLPAGQTDTKLEKFDLGPDKKDVIPLLKQILTINPKIKILGSPWSAPVWMKTNGHTRGGSLKPEYYEAYANYLVKYLTEMQRNGITIDAITVQNEPLNPANNPSMYMEAADVAAFIKTSLGPAFKAAGIKTKIVIYDHNADRPDYPITVLNDPEAKKYIDGSAFHLYQGDIDALSRVHKAHPDKNLYFTEQMVIDDRDSSQFKVSKPVSDVFIGATRNWCRNVLEWNLAADAQNQPHTDRGGCPMCQGAVTINNDAVKRSIAYYAMAHFSKFVRPGAVRVASNNLDALASVAFKLPDSKKVLIVTNTGTTTQIFDIFFKGKAVTTSLKAGSVATYLWQ
ncbi:glucosylceramidase [Mucilaginibacter gracilis]|uniref:Glucosylceramidase n=1 Tax=Mucilaginibacter gracilis TaxID=423350 RepID=A0A495J593_9SPHI|nr:glycoside hydrolase family 30 beta sandwich domain-containing protein [Mucilaginibacter gracilis]RKR83782.1 glucosylceramidase [Mucilaginibacter gracilis]